jgi:hypothetical protein
MRRKEMPRDGNGGKKKEEEKERNATCTRTSTYEFADLPRYCINSHSV